MGETGQLMLAEIVDDQITRALEVAGPEARVGGWLRWGTRGGLLTRWWLIGEGEEPFN